MTIDPIFAVHKLNDIGFAKAQAIANGFDSLLDSLTDVCGNTGREIAIVKTKLEEACFFAKKAMANQSINQAND